MKQKLFFLVCFFVAMAAIPIVTVNFETKNIRLSTADEVILDEPSDENICKIVASLCNNEFCDESLEAIARIVKTNMKSGFKYEIEEISDKELYLRLKDIINSKTELLLYHNNVKYIPHSFCSDGSTNYNENYNYLSPVASPWDCFCEEYEQNLSCSGVSLYGIDYLCKNGMSGEDALSWYLPEFMV